MPAGVKSWAGCTSCIQADPGLPTLDHDGTLLSSSRTQMTPYSDLSPLPSSAPAPSARYQHSRAIPQGLRTPSTSLAALTSPAPHRRTQPPSTISLPFHPFPNELFSFLLLFGEPLGPQEPFGLILEGWQVPTGAGREGIAAAGAPHGTGHRRLRLGGVLQGQEGGEGRGPRGERGSVPPGASAMRAAVRKGLYGPPLSYNN